MIKKLLVLALCLSTPLFLVNCTSNEAKEEGDETAVEESATTEDGEEETSEETAEAGEESTDEDSGEETADAGEETETSTEDTASTAEQTPDALTSSDTATETPAAPTDTAAATTPSDTAMPSDTSTLDSTMGTTDSQSNVFAGSAGIDTGGSSETTEMPKQNFPYLKAESVPFKRAGVLLNTVYLARPGDTWKKVSEKTIGEGKHRDLKKQNPSLAHRELRVGDKVYYNSPTRAEDSSRIITYFEDKNIPPQAYTVKPGESIRTIAKQLLGDKDSWKELYATNAVDSKGVINEPTELRYWTDSADAGTQQVAAAPTPAMNEIPPPPAMEEFPPPPMEPMPTVGATEPMAPPSGEMTPPPVDMAPPPPPEPPIAVEPPPPPPPMEPSAEEASMEEEAPAEDDMMLMGGGAAVLLALVILLIMRRRKSQQDASQEQVFADTNVGGV